MNAVQIPKEKYISGDGHTIIYVLKDKDFSGTTMRGTVRRRKTFSDDNSLFLASPQVEYTIEGADTKIVVHFTAAQTRNMGSGGWFDVQVEIEGEEPITIIQQQLIGDGDTTK